jgi:UDP-N-acetylmuramoyl-tripeptide--D-alanyl-D-alanine ligase
MNLELQDIARAISAAPPDGNPVIADYSTDSRTAVPGCLYLALRGPNYDGHAFVQAAFDRGAAAAVVEVERGQAKRPAPPELPAAGQPQLAVPDVQGALEALAAWARRRWQGTVVAITGSAGKTTTKEVAARLLASEMAVGKTEGNLNNHIGVPLSILRLPEQAQAAVIEIGMNHAGEIRRLAAIARPTVGVVTNAGFAHAEFFRSVDEVALAKRELIEALPPDGTAVLNADDERVAAFGRGFGGRVVTFGFAEDADVRAEAVEYGPQGVRFRVDGTEFESSFVGRHGVMNILAGLAVARVFSIPPARLAAAVRSLEPVRMRGERYAWGGATILDDCYNSNPEAVRAMLDALRVMPARRRIAVLGEMLELGDWSEPLHRGIGSHAVQCGIDVLVGIRGAARQTIDEAVRSGLPASAAVFFDEPEAAGEFLRGLIRPGDAILFKGSRGTQVERALQTLTGAGGGNH